MNDDSDTNASRGKRKRKIIQSDDSSDSDNSIVVAAKKRRKKRHIPSDSESDSSIEVPKKRVGRVQSDDDDSSGSEIVRIRRHVGPVESDSESETDSDSDWVSETEDVPKSASPLKLNPVSSSDDENSEKCPICLLPFKMREVASPESCDHAFCVECILEWSKNINTCPVDRQTYNLILVRKNFNGKIVKQIPIEPPQPPSDVNEIEEDPTFCEVCGRCDREDRMLLCDTCDQGYHLECLDPPLEEVPMGLWYCEECEPHSRESRTVDYYEVHLLLEDAETLGWPAAPRRRQSRVTARTRQTERVRARIITHRHQRRQQEAAEAPGPSGPSRRRTTRAPGATVRRRKVKRKSKSTKGRKKKSRAEKKEALRIKATKTVKRRLAVQLGMCPNRQTSQMLPDVRIPSQPNNVLGFQRGQAGIPTLHLFGQNDSLEYFSDSEGEDASAGVNLLVRRRPNLSDASILRRAARRKTIAHPSISPPSTTNILDSILDIQSKFHSKNSVLSLNKDGSLKIDATNKNNPTNNNKDNRDLNAPRRQRFDFNNSYNEYVRQRPNYGGSGQPGSSPRSTNDPEQTATRSEITENVNMVSTSSGDGFERRDGPAEEDQGFSQHPVCSSYDSDKKDQKEKSRSNTPNTDSDLDIYSDIETVSTSRAEEFEVKPTTPVSEPANHSEDENSDADLVIDTEKQEDPKEQVSSSADVLEAPSTSEVAETPHSTTEIQNETVQSTISKTDDEKDRDEDEESEDGCPNFSIYSKESMNIAKTTKEEILSEQQEINNPQASEEEPEEPMVKEPVTYSKDASSSKKDGLGLYSDSEDEEIVKTNQPFGGEPQQPEIGAPPDEQPEKPFEINDIINMTEDISEEERSYTPCLDERSQKQGLEGLDTEMISDEEDRNDFDESHEVKTASDGGDALEINAKESELDFSKPEDYEEGEIVDKSKAKQDEKPEEPKETREEPPEKPEEVTPVVDNNKENETQTNFKKITKKDRNYRDKDKERSKSKEKEKSDKENKREQRKKEKRKEIERYNVRSLIAEKPRRMKDKFGRDERRRSTSKSSRSPTPRRSRTPDRQKKRKRISRSRTPERRRSRSRKQRSSPKRQEKRRKTPERKKPPPRQRTRSRSRHREFPRRWSRTRSRSFSPKEAQRLSPSWTPPRAVEPQRVKPQNLTVILNNDLNKKKKEKKGRDGKGKAGKAKKRRREKTPPPSKEVFASGNNILVSVSFNKDTGERDVTKRKRDVVSDTPAKKSRKDREKKKTDERKRKKNKELAGVKPVAIIDLDRSPFRELTPSPEDVIVLTDSDNNESNDVLEKGVCDSSQQAVTPERPANASYLTGPKTPPEPQVKFTLNPKQNQVRAINNPLHEPDEIEGELDVQEELEQRLNDTLHKGPNTPPEPPNSPPSSPDAYDPFDPTKSRSPTPVELSQTIQSTTQEKAEISESKDADEKSHTPPVIADIQPADSQTNIKVTTPEKTTPPDQLIGVIINQVVQSAAAALPAFSNSIITSTPNLPAPRVNILNSTIITPPTMSAVPQRIVLPNTTKSSPVKVSPSKMPIKSTPIKPMPVKAQAKPRKSGGGNQNGSDAADATLDFDSPYSPGSSDYEDLFEPPTESGAKGGQNRSGGKNSKSPVKGQNTFDVLFGTSPVNNLFKNKPKKASGNKYKKAGKGKGNTKQVGVKIDEDTLKILDDLPNSAVEMQVKDKFVDDWVLTVGPTVVCNKEKLQYLKKLNRQERVVEEVKLVLKPHYNKKHINKEEYKDILRRAVPKICHNKSGEINPQKIQNLIEAYVKKIRHNKKVTSSSSVNPQKV